ncbi:MAG: NAD(P)H-hydrate dehydratase [Ignavibacteriales bacterium]|nr:NAD(P)H-hydrate dehydratase [Ignavibacteriales bacterium]
MQQCDRYAINTLKIPGLILMENAGRGTVDLIEKRYGPVLGKKFIVVCGKGNNGGDGFVIARHLFVRGGMVVTVLIGKSSELKGDAKTNYLTLSTIERKYGTTKKLKLLQDYSKKKISMLPKADFIIDALFGTGFKGKVCEPQLGVIQWINNRPEKKISIDIPSGIDADTGTIGNNAVTASDTATMGFKKIGLTIGDGREYAGKVDVIDISLPDEIIKTVEPNNFIVGIDDVKKLLPRRRFNAHKHSVGKIILLAGSRGMTGAAALTARAAMRAGAGSVILGTPKSVYPILGRKMTEVMVEPLPETEYGTLSLDAYNFIDKYSQWADIVICGPGFSRNPESAELIWKIVSSWKKPLLLDADGLNNISEKLSILKNHAASNFIITPHTGEFSRLTGLTTDEINRNRPQVVRDITKQFKLTCVLKGAPTITGSDNGKIFINSTGNAGMASAGMGDVLTGIIGGLWAQGVSQDDAAIAGVYLHGLAGDFAKIKFGEKSLMALDLLSLIPESLLHIEKHI